MKKRIILALLAPLWSVSAQSSSSLKELPTKVDAEKGLECDKDNKVCKAFKATLTYDTMTLRGDVITAYFEEKGLQKVEVEGHVHAHSQKAYQATGNSGSLNLETGVLTLSGAAEIIDIQEKKILRGGKLVALLKRSPLGKVMIQRVNGYNRLELITPKEVVKADEGVYEIGTEFITLTGNVHITSKNGQLKGDKATMNLKTGLSRMTSSKKPVQVLLLSQTEARGLK